MKKLAAVVLVLFGLTAAAGPLHADERFDNRYGFGVNASLEWQLGNFSRGHGYQILYREPGRGRWQVAPGSAVAVGDGWVLGTDRKRGGYGIYRWNGSGWSRMPGAAVSLGGSYNQPWVVNDRGVRYVWNGNDWREDRQRGRDDSRGRDQRDFRRNDRGDDRNDRRDDRDERRRDDRDERGSWRNRW